MTFIISTAKVYGYFYSMIFSMYNMDTSLDFQEIIASGIKAPSGHNTQPWKFEVLENEIQIYPDFGRALPVVDADNHALYISLGCVAENIVLAAANKGYKARTNILKDDNGAEYISIKLKTDPAVTKDGLFDYIGKRQVTRNAYKDIPVAPEDFQHLLKAAEMDGIRLLSFTSKQDKAALEAFIIEGNNLQFENSAFMDELISWIRFSQKEAEAKRDGVWHASMGFPRTGRKLGRLIMKRFVSPKSEAGRWKKIIAASAGFLLFAVEKNDPESWIKLGKAFQRFGLTATKLNISHAHVNMPCEEPRVRNKMAAAFGLDGALPLLLIRYGYSKKMPYSYRRPVEAFVQAPAKV